MDYTFRFRENRSSSPVKLTRQTAHSVEIIREENEKGKLGGFGFTLLYEKPPIVGTVTPNSPAEQAGLKCKEVIISVNDIPVEDLSHKEVVKLIENTPSTGVWLTVREPDSQCETPDGFSGPLKRNASISVPGFSPEDYHKLDHRSRSSSFGRSYRRHSPSPTRSSSTNLHRRQSSFDDMRRTSDAGRTSSPSKLMVSSRVSSSHSLGTSSPRSGSLPRAPIRATVLVQYIGPVEMPQKWSSRGMSSRCIRECTKRIASERREYVPLEVYLDLGLSNLKLLNSNKNTLVHYGRKELYYCGVHLDDDHYFGIVTRHSKLLDEMGQSVSTVMSETTHPKTIHRCHVFRIIPPDRAVEMQVQYSGAGNFHHTVKVTNAHAIVQVVRDIYNQEMSTDQQQRPLSTGSQDLKVPDFSLSGASASSEGSSTSSLSTTSGSSYDHTPSHKKKHVVDLTPRHSTSFDVEDGKYSRHRESLERHFYGWKSSQTPERDLHSSAPHFNMPKWTPSPESFKHHRYEDLDRFPNLLNKRDSFSSSNWSGPSGGSEAYFQVADPQSQLPGPVYATVNKPKGGAPLVRQSSDSSLCVPATESTTTDSVTGELTAKHSTLPAKNGHTSSSMTSLWSTTTAGEEPQGRVAGWAASFDRLLQDPIGLRYFMTFLKQEHSEENLLFWLACDEFKKTVKAIPSMLAPSSEKLFNDFVDPVVSVQEVNIDDKFRKDLEARLKTPSIDMFDEVQHQVYRLMSMDSFPRFTRSGAFKELLVQDLGGKQLPVLDVTPYVETNPTPQQVELAKPKTITRANSTKERHWSLFGRKSRTEHDMNDDDKKKKDFKRKGSKKEVHHPPAEQKQSLPQDQDEQGHRQWLNEKLNNVFEIVLTGNITKLVPVPKSGTVRDALMPLLTRQKYSFETVDIKLAASLQSVDLEMPASTLDGQHLVVIQRPDTFTVTLPNSELFLPADGQKLARDICIPALTKEGLDPSSVVLYLLGSRVPLDLNVPGYLLKGQRIVVKMVANSAGLVTMVPQDMNTNNVNDDNPLPNTSSATDMEDLLEMLMRVQGDTLDQQRSAEPTPEPIIPGNSPHKNSPSGLVTSSRSSSSNSTHKDRDTPSPHKSELVPPGRAKRHASGNDAVDHSCRVPSPLEHRHSQSGSVPSLNLSSYSPLPMSPPAALSQESDVKQQDDHTSISSQDQQVEMRDLRSKSASPSFDKVQVRRELKDWVASKSDYSRSRQQQPVHGKLSSPATTGNRYQHHASPLPPLTRSEHQSEANRRSFNSSNSSTPPMVSPPGSVISSHTSNANSLDSWVMQADSKAAAPHHGNNRSRSPTMNSRYNHQRATMSPPRKDNYGRPIRQPAYQTVQGWKARTQPSSYTGPASPGLQAQARRYSQGRPALADDRRLLMKGDKLLQKELEETRAEQGSYHYATTAVAMNKHVPQHRQLPLSPPDSASSIVSGSIPAQQQKHYISIAGSNTHETRV